MAGRSICEGCFDGACFWGDIPKSPRKAAAQKGLGTVITDRRGRVQTGESRKVDDRFVDAGADGIQKSGSVKETIVNFLSE